MIVFLPRAVDGLAQFEATLTAARLTEWVGRMAEREVVVILPRFRVTVPLPLERVLQELGMRRMFSDLTADFSGMVSDARVSVSRVVHNAYVEVDEKGTEAAAATGMVATLSSAPPPRPLFKADHPFFYAIRDNRSGALLFVGRLVDPGTS